jgi:hypothetical protein
VALTGETPSFEAERRALRGFIHRVADLRAADENASTDDRYGIAAAARACAAAWLLPIFNRLSERSHFPAPKKPARIGYTHR